MFDFSEQVVLVTGAAGNLGSAVARAFAAAGAKLSLVDRAAERLVDVYSDMAGSPDYLFIHSIDLMQAEDVQRMARETFDRFGRIDVLVNTAGGYRAGTPVHQTPLETWDFMLNLNARTAFLASQAVIPYMLEPRRGKIIHIAARAGLKGGANSAAYSAAKSAVLRLTESMAAELGEAGINVNCIMPGTLDTPANRQAMPNADYSRWAKPEAVAEVIMFLASDSARILHGVAIPV
jgi:NAD(P)-dependent dehydrogenase (short-subunit alcohol dehydrogenase family)